MIGKTGAAAGEEELRTLISRFYRREHDTADLIRMSRLAWELGRSGLMNAEDDAFHGAKEAWLESALNAEIEQQEAAAAHSSLQ